MWWPESHLQSRSLLLHRILTAIVLESEVIMTRDRGTGIVAVLLGIYVFFYTNTIPNPTSAGDSAGPRVFPYITAAILVICGIGDRKSVV